YITDKTLKQTGKKMQLSFREKIELSRLIDRLEPDVIELAGIENKKVDSLLIKSIAAAVSHAEVAVPVKLSMESVAETWNALKEARVPRLQVVAPVSSVQMEYLSHLKPSALHDRVVETVKECSKYTDNIEFIAEDAFRGENSFMIPLIKAVTDAGAKRITFQEAAGAMLPEEMCDFLKHLIEKLDNTEGIRFGIDCSDAICLADACAVESVRSGILELKTAAFPIDCASLSHVVRILASSGEKLNVYCQTRREELRRVIGKIENLCGSAGDRLNIFDGASVSGDEEVALTSHDSRESVIHSMEQLGYILSSEDQDKVYTAFLSIAEKKGSVSLKELDALIAAEAMQVPPAYIVQQYVINTGSGIGAIAHMKIENHGQALEGISAGDGVIDAAFLALEQAIGRHFELDNFQIQAITEGQKAMGETIVRLRSEGRLYSGRGISTDIVGASIMAYMNALNKIVFEEEEA
ncbi:MAG: hypothetical protein J6P40_02200, partial [Oscillospiraceae bacterium]|nr:hypothetical protein [Oscillospiraceae bacterium]